MQRAIIPSVITKGAELIVIPRDEYEALRRCAQRKKTLIDRRLEKALAAVERGEVSKAFASADAFVRSLRHKR